MRLAFFLLVSNVIYCTNTYEVPLTWLGQREPPSYTDLSK